MQGFVPNASGEGFTLQPKHFLKMCIDAKKQPDKIHVLVIDELSRAEPGRVFGEALTYVERSKRGDIFQLASGEDCVVPPNLVLLATMNPLDRGVDEVDAAFERRFAKIALEPDAAALERMLARNRLPAPLRERVLRFFHHANRLAQTGPYGYGAIGHAYFAAAEDEDSLREVWDHQLRFLIQKAYRLDPATVEELTGAWERIFRDEQVIGPESVQ